MKVSVRELKDHLSEYLRRVGAGEEVVVTSHGKPVARLGPVSLPPVNTEVAALERIRSLPWVYAGNGKKPQGAKHPIKIKPGEKSLSDIVIEDRE